MTEQQKAEEALKLARELLARFHYGPVPLTLEFGDVRASFRALLPAWCKEEGEIARPLYTPKGTLLAVGYERIVTGDYGPFAEFLPRQICPAALCMAQGQEFRVRDPEFKDRVKYVWLTAADGSGIKVYEQKRPVRYADYLPGRLYVNPYELTPDPAVPTPGPARGL